MVFIVKYYVIQVWIVKFSGLSFASPIIDIVFRFQIRKI